MKEQPIIFSGEMVRAILEGRKTQTRRVMKPQPPEWVDSCGWTAFTPEGHVSGRGRYEGEPAEKFFRNPYGQSGTLLWVREAFQFGQAPNDTPGQGVVRYANGAVRVHPDLPDGRRNWARIYRKRSSIFMPRWASRIDLQVTRILCERLQEISERDCCLEMGCAVEWPGPGPEPYKRNLRALFGERWDSINAKRGYGWDSNPWVWVVEFKVIGK